MSIAPIGASSISVPTTGPGTAGGLAREAIAGGADLVLAAGGDGTINEAAEGVIGSAVPFGILPAGYGHSTYRASTLTFHQPARIVVLFIELI
jgi:diacylglycerol kinase family enzyme